MHGVPLVFQARQAQPSDSQHVLHNQVLGRARRGPLTLWVIGRARRGPVRATPPDFFADFRGHDRTNNSETPLSGA